MITISSLGSLLCRRFLHCASFGTAFLLALGVLDSRGAQLKEARVSQVIRDVKLLPNQAAPRPASVSDEVRDGTAIRTGLESRAELTFTDQTLARLGANTIFSFNEGTRNLQLDGGAMLLRVPKNAGGARINTAAVTAAITGTTIMLEYHPDAYIKFIILEGTGRIFRNDRIGESVLLHAGQMLIVNPKGKGLPDPVDVDLDRLIKTSLLINGFRPLPSDSLIAREIQQQLNRKDGGELVETNLVIFGRGTLVSLLDPTNSDVLDQANANETRQMRESPTPTPTVTMTPTPTVTMTPTPTPGKSGTPPVITSPDPYVITSGTTIQTDPTITTRGRTNLGTIYNGTKKDGKASTFLFGSTSAFDTASGFDSHFGNPANSPMGVFKFSSLVLAGNPTISLTNGGVTKLGLISVGDLTSGTAPATLTFAGIDSLLLATQNGSITIGSNITFENIPTLFLYARGANSTLTFDATVNGTTNLVLFAENNIRVTDSLTVKQTSPAGFADGIFDTIIAGNAINVGGDLVLSIDTSGTNNDSGINVATDNGPLTIGGLLSLTITSTSGTIKNGADLNLNAGTDLSADTLALTLDLASAQTTVANGANIVVNTGGDFTVNNAATFNLLHNGGGNIVNGGNIFVITGGDFAAGSIDALINNRDGGSIATGGNLVFDIGGALTTTGDASFVVSGRDDAGVGGGSFGSGAVISINTGSISIGGLFNVGSGLSAGGNVGLAANSIFATGSLTTGGSFLFNIQNGGANVNDVQTGGAIIANDATLSLTATSVAIGDLLDLFINNLDGGTIGRDALVGFNASGPVTVQTDATFEITNGTIQGSTLTSSIGGDASVVVSAGSFSGATLLTQIFNVDGASIGGDADLSFTVKGALSTTGNSTFRIVNFDDGEGLGGGTIDGDATINVNAGSLSAAAVVARINNLGGTVAGSSDIIFGITGALTTTGDATFEVLQDSSGPTASVAIAAGSFSIGGNLVARISDLETSFDIENVSVSATRNMTVSGAISVDGNVTAGGNISAGGGIFTPGDPIVVSAGGSISAPGVITGTLSAGTTITIDNSQGGFGFGIIANTISAGGNLNLINVPTISPNNASSDGTTGFTPVDFSLTAANIISTGPTFPILSSNGSDTDPNVGNGNPGSGGNITINITNAGLDVGAGDDLAQIIANGGAFANNAILGGNGGTIDITATEDVNVDGNITADTGVNPTGTPAGNGGTVNITTAGAVTVNSVIQTSDNGSGGSNSAKGGNIALTSSKPSGVAINISNSGQLLALLDQAAPGPGGKITILATGGGGSSVTVNGGVQADKGTVDIRHTGAGGTVNLGTGGNTVTLHGDVVKAGALGNNGVLTIGQGSISADDTLKLYGQSANGQVHFIDNVTIGGGNFTIIAADTVTVDNGKTVTVSGAKADVYVGFVGGVPNANYNATQGGNGQTSGLFGGSGVNLPQPIANAPPFDGPPGG